MSLSCPLQFPWSSSRQLLCVSGTLSSVPGCAAPQLPISPHHNRCQCLARLLVAAGIGLLRPSGHIYCSGIRSFSALLCLQSPHLIRIYLAHTSPGNLLSHLSHFVTPRKYALLTFFTILLSLYMQPIGHWAESKCKLTFPTTRSVFTPPTAINPPALGLSVPYFHCQAMPASASFGRSQPAILVPLAVGSTRHSSANHPETSGFIALPSKRLL